MRTPLNAVLGFAREAKRKDITSEQRDDYLGKVELSGKLLLNLINDTLTMAETYGIYADRERRLQRRLLVLGMFLAASCVLIVLLFSRFIVSLERTIDDINDNLAHLSKHEWDVKDLSGHVYEEFVDLFGAVNRMVNILASVFFGGISGSATADTASLGSILIPMMVKQGYDVEFSTAVTMTSSVEGMLIPPSHNMRNLRMRLRYWS